MDEGMILDSATGQLGLFDGDAEYEAFEEKFKVKKTSDDCYTPENVHEAVMGWVEREYRVDRSDFLRPFWPGADYRNADYPEGCIVVDNPPFSIRSEIVDFYLSRHIRFFLYAPALMLLGGWRSGVCCIAVGASVTYDNGAVVRTSFCTNLDTAALRTAPELYRAIEAANTENVRRGKVELPKYAYPDHVITAAMAQRYCKYGVSYRLEAGDCVKIGALDSQRGAGKSIFGDGFLLSDGAAAERAAAERAAAERAAATAWALSDREKEIVAGLGTVSSDGCAEACGRWAVEVRRDQAD